MKNSKPLAIMTGLVTLWMVALAVHLGCDATTSLTQPPGLVGSSAQTVKVTAFLSDKPMYFAPDSSATRSNFVDVSSQVPSDARTATFSIRPNLIDLVVEDIPARGRNGFTIQLAVSDSASGEAEVVGTFDMEVGADGTIVTVNNDSFPVGDHIVDLMKRRTFVIDIDVAGDFDGGVTVGQADIDITIGGPLGGNTNSNTDDDNGNGDDGNANDDGNSNDDGNTNDNTGDDNGNDNAGNTNDNTGDDNSNGNTGDDNSNDNAGNTNDNAGNTNDNTGDDNSNGNTGDDNSNDNAGNTNDNTDDNTNDNTDDNSNDNADDNSNDNTDDNMNDNSVDGVCPDGSIQLRTEIEGADDFEVEVEYRENGESCRRFRLDIEGFPQGWHDVFADGVLVGAIFADSEDGEGRLRLETDDGNMPTDFPFLVEGDVVSIGTVIDVTMQVHCSEIWSCANGNGNDNTGGNTNDNTGDNTNDNAGDNSNDNTGDNTNLND